MMWFFYTCSRLHASAMEDGGVDTTVIESWQHKMGQMADFLPLLASSVFDLQKYDEPQIDIYLGLEFEFEFEFGPQRIRDLAFVCP